MYDAEIRATYAEMYKTANAGAMSRIGPALSSAASEHPLIAAALSAALAGGGGYALGKHNQKHEDESKVTSWTNGFNYGHSLHRGGL
jgi:hypothetical protein